MSGSGGAVKFAACPIISCHNSIQLVHSDGEVVIVTSGDLCNRSENVAQQLRQWLRDWCETVDLKKHCRHATAD